MGALLHSLCLLVIWSLFALLLNILIEWAGMLLGLWPHTHAKTMLQSELAWLNQDFRSVVLSPANFAQRFSRFFYDLLFVWGQTDVAALLLNTFAKHAIRDYLLAAIIITQVFALRVIVIVFSLPVFLVFAIAAVCDGLVERDLRKWGGGREHGWLWHHVKPWIVPAFILPVIIYLSLPISLHPNWVLMPFALIFAAAIWMTSAFFKKHI